MTNREKYRFDDFTLSNYSRLLDLALENGYVFSDYSLQSDEQNNRREIIWRHDVEFSVHKALKMAMIEADKGIKAHYFVQLHCEFYNTFEREIYELLMQIRDLGHYICLHFDAHFWQVDSKDKLELYLERDKNILEDLLEIKISSFSFHNTTPQLLALDDLYYAGILNVYAKAIRSKYSYCTDSTGIWRFERLEDVLMDSTIKYLQVLTHDGMWQDEAMSPRQRVFACIDGRAQKVKILYDECLLQLGQKNIEDV